MATSSEATSSHSISEMTSSDITHQRDPGAGEDFLQITETPQVLMDCSHSLYRRDLNAHTIRFNSCMNA